METDADEGQSKVCLSINNEDHYVKGMQGRSRHIQKYQQTEG